MTEKIDWLPIDTRILPLDFSFKYPKSKLIRVALYLELFLALLSVFGTLLLTILPPSNPLPSQTQAVSSSSPEVPAGYQR